MSLEPEANTMRSSVSEDDCWCIDLRTIIEFWTIMPNNLPFRTKPVSPDAVSKLLLSCAARRMPRDYGPYEHFDRSDPVHKEAGNVHQKCGE